VTTDGPEKLTNLRFRNRLIFVTANALGVVVRQNSDLLLNQDELRALRCQSPCETGSMLCLLRLLPVLAIRLLRSYLIFDRAAEFQ
jgi:hypothetical protein